MTIMWSDMRLERLINDEEPASYRVLRIDTLLGIMLVIQLKIKTIEITSLAIEDFKRDLETKEIVILEDDDQEELAFLEASLSDNAHNRRDKRFASLKPILDAGDIFVLDAQMLRHLIKEAAKIAGCTEKTIANALR